MMTIILIMAAILVVIVLSPFLIKRLARGKNNLDKWTKISGITGVVIGTLSLLFAAYSFYETSQTQKGLVDTQKELANKNAEVQTILAQENSRIQRVLAAAGIYQEHMKMSIAHPGLADGRIAPIDPGKDFCPKTTEDVQKMNDYEKYRWYVGHALFSFETILEVEDDTEWGSVVDAFIRDHHTYIGSYAPSEGFPCWRYTTKLQERLRTIFNKTCPPAPTGPPERKPPCPNIPRPKDKDL